MATSEQEQSRAENWYIQRMREVYLADSASLGESWRRYFSTQSAPPQLRVVKLPLSPLQYRQGTAQVPTNALILAKEAFTQDTTRTGMNEESATRSDLPPAPPSTIAEASSPYACQLRAHSASMRSSNTLNEDESALFKGVTRATARNMDDSLSILIATPQRQVLAKLLIENRTLLSAHPVRTTGGEVPFTHLIGYALVEALCEMSELSVRHEMTGVKPTIHRHTYVGLGLAIDVAMKNGERSLMVPVTHDADTLTFMEFVAAHQDIVQRARMGELTTADFTGVTITLTNPRTLGTTTSMPRLMNDQGAIIGVGATDYPAQYRGISVRRPVSMAISRTTYLSSTYSHRITQGAALERFLGPIDKKLSGVEGFYERIFTSLHISVSPYAWEADVEYDPEREKGKPARIVELIHAFRSRGYLAADTDPLAYRVRHHPDLDTTRYGLSIWDLDRPFPTGGFGGVDQILLRNILAHLHDTHSRSPGIGYMHIQDLKQRAWVQGHIEGLYEAPLVAEQRHILQTLIRAEVFEEFF